MSKESTSSNTANHGSSSLTEWVERFRQDVTTLLGNTDDSSTDNSSCDDDNRNNDRRPLSTTFDPVQFQRHQQHNASNTRTGFRSGSTRPESAYFFTGTRVASMDDAATATATATATEREFQSLPRPPPPPPPPELLPPLPTSYSVSNPTLRSSDPFSSALYSTKGSHPSQIGSSHCDNENYNYNYNGNGNGNGDDDDDDGLDYYPTKELRRYRRHRKGSKASTPICDKTTFWLAVICAILTLVLAILLIVVRPFRTNQPRIPDSIQRNPHNSFVPVQSPIRDAPRLTAKPASNPAFPSSEPTWEPNSSRVRTDSLTASPTQQPQLRFTLPPTPSQNPPTETPRTKPSIRDTTADPVAAPSTAMPTVRPTARPTARPIPATPVSPSASASASASAAAAASKVGDPMAVPEARPAKPKVGAVDPLAMGPMVGHTTHDSVTLWAYHGKLTDYKMEILLYDSDTDGLLRTIDMVGPRPLLNGAVRETISGLQPNTLYKYGMHIHGHRVGKGSFRTAPVPFQPSKFNYILASCMNHRQYKSQPVWTEISRNNPQPGSTGEYPHFAVLAGDTVYLQEGVDVTSQDGVKFDRVWFRNLEQRREPHFAKFLSSTPTYATWNDHEYGANNANRDQKGKTNSLRAWESLWANPGYGSHTNEDDGVYFSYYWGDVHFIVTDDHWYRDPSRGNRLGEEQTEWLANELIHSKGTFKVIVIGSDIMERNWSSDLENIGKVVIDHSIDGVLFHAGDIHKNEYKRMDYSGIFPYPVTQVTSSGIAKVWRRPYAHLYADTTAEDPFLQARFYGASSTSEDTTWTNDPNLRCSSIVGIDRDKEHRCTETIRLSDLRANLFIN